MRWIGLDNHRNTFQIIVSSFLPNKTDLTYGSEFLERSTDSHAILVSNKTIHQQGGGNQDITQKGESYIRGKWVTIVALDLDSPFELAEIRVYGSEYLLLLIGNESYVITFQEEFLMKLMINLPKSIT